MQPSDEPLHLFRPENRVLLKTWKNQGPNHQLAEKWLRLPDILLTTHLSKTKGCKAMDTPHQSEEGSTYDEEAKKTPTGKAILFRI